MLPVREGKVEVLSVSGLPHDVGLTTNFAWQNTII